MKRVLLCLVATLLGGCVLIQFTTRVSLAGSESRWLLYVEEPTSAMEFSKHGLFYGNIPNRYMIEMPARSGYFESSRLSVLKSVNGAYVEKVPLSGGSLEIKNCVVTISLKTNAAMMSFNGRHALPSYGCKAS